MFSRGFFGFVTGDVEKIAYVHDGSHPHNLGATVLTWLRRELTHDGIALRRHVAALRVVCESDQPSRSDMAALAPWTDLTVSRQTVNDWYCLLRGTQGNPAAMLAAGVVLDSGGFPADSAWAKWGYVVDLDADRFEVYQGSQVAHTLGRFASRTFGDCHPCTLVYSWPLVALPSDQDFIDALHPFTEVGT